MRKFILKLLNAVDIDKYVSNKLQYENAINNLNKKINELEDNLKRQRRKISSLENELLMYKDPDNWYEKHKEKMSIITSAMLNKKDK